jgi:hypothetical protein
MTVSVSRVQFIWSPLLGWALLTCSASIAAAQIGVAIPGVSDTPPTTSDQTVPSPAGQTGTGGYPGSGTIGGQSPVIAPTPVTRPSYLDVIPLPPGTTVQNPSTQIIPGASDTFAGAVGGPFNGSNAGGPPSGDELGITVGSFKLYPAIDISTGIDNNVFAVNAATTTPSASPSTVVAPSLALRSDWLNHSINFLAGGGFGFYASAPTQNYQNYFLIVDGRIDVREDLAVVYSGGYRRATEALGTANVTFAQAPTVVESIPVALGLRKQFNRFSVEAGASATRYWFTDYSVISSSGLDAQNRNRIGYEEHIRFGYELTDDLTLYLTPSVSQTRYDLNPDTIGQDRNSDNVNLGLGAAWTINATSALAGSVGYTTQASGGVGSTSTYTFALSGTWNGYQPLTLRPALSRAITETALSNYASTIATTIGIDYSYVIFDEFTVVGGFSYSVADYQPIPGLGAPPRQDYFGRASIGFLWTPRPQFSIGPVFEYTQGNSTDTITGPLYNRELISLRLSARR